MPGLSTVDMKLIDSLFGMYSGWVLDFSNDRFDAFFRRDVGVNINDDAYAIYGGSKGKRLRGFLEVGQTAAIVKALNALWVYREAIRSDKGEAETVPNARSRLSALIEKLGGKPLPTDPSTASSESTHAKPMGPSDAVLASLQSGFMAMHVMDDAAQARGYAFERFLKSWFDALGVERSGIVQAHR